MPGIRSTVKKVFKECGNGLVGEMVIELPEDKTKANIMKDYLTEVGIIYWEVDK